jgi:hypothetical protein
MLDWADTVFNPAFEAESKNPFRVADPQYACLPRCSAANVHVATQLPNYHTLDAD